MRRRAEASDRCPSPIAIDDPPAVEVVRRELDLDPVAGIDANPVAAHLAGGVRDQLVAVVEPHAEHPAREGLEHLALHLDLFLAADCPRPPSFALRQWRRPSAFARRGPFLNRLD